MKRFFSNSPLLCFNIFALLIAARDAFTQFLLVEKVDPIFMLFVYCAVTSVVAFGVNIAFNRASVLDRVLHQEKGTMAVKIGLGVFTWLSFLATIYGIQAIGAPIFSLIEHSLIPVSTVLLAAHYLRETMSRQMRAGLFICVISLGIFLLASQTFDNHGASTAAMGLGIALAIASSLLTSVNSAFQKKLVSLSYTPDEVLFFRFVIPAACMTFMLPLADVHVLPAHTLVSLVLLALFGFALPLVFLCLGFVKASLGRFSAFNILIPAYTFLIGPILVRGEASRLSNPWILAGIGGITLGYVIFEWAALRNVFVALTRTSAKPASEVST